MTNSTRRLEYDALLNYAVRALTARAQSAGELRVKLERKAARAADVGEVLSRLKELGYLDDRRFAESFTNARLENDGLGKARVLQDLRRRRVARAVAEKAVSRAYAETDESALVEAWLKRKYRAVALESWLAEPKNLASAYRRLRVAGFSASTVLTVLKRFASEPEMLESLESGEPAEEGEE